MTKRFLWFICALFFLQSQIFCHSGSSSSNYIILDDTADNAGNTASSAGYKLLSAVGQQAAEHITSAGYENFAGFLHSGMLAPQNTATASPTQIISPTFTATFTASSTGTRTPTLTYSQTYTQTVTATIMQTNTFSSTPTPSITQSGTVIITLTLTLMQSATNTGTCIYTDTPVPTATFTATPASTASFTATAADTPSVTVTQLISQTPTYYYTFTATVTVTNTPNVNMQGGQLIVYPNPAADYATVRFEDDLAGDRVEIMIYNLNAELCYKKAFDRSYLNVYALDILKLPEGIYVLMGRMINDGQSVFYGRFNFVILRE